MTTLRKRAFCMMVIGAIIWLGMLMVIESYTITRFSMIAALLLIVSGGILLIPRISIRLIGCVFLSMYAVIGIARSNTVVVDRDAYVCELKVMEGLPYYWGAESNAQVDCSGLLRKAYLNAIHDTWLDACDPGRAVLWTQVWFFDCSAREMSRGYGGKIVSVHSQGKINTFDTGTLSPGDLAVTITGVHCLAYVGAADWISADPGLGKVVIKRAPDPAFSWYDAPVAVFRWKQLQ
jgi:hypothetical protein